MHSHRPRPHRAVALVGVAALATVVAAAPARGAVAPPTVLQRITAADGNGATGAVHDVRTWSATSAIALRRMTWPTRGRVTSEFGPRGGRRHAGIDIGAPTGRRVTAADSGRVAFSGWKGGYGRTVIVAHGGGTRTLYGHLSAVDVAAGDHVDRGERLGAVGSTGWSTGPHLHFEVREHGDPRDPRAHLVPRP